MYKTQKLILMVLLVAICGRSIARQEVGARQFSLSEALEHALENNTEVLNADLDSRIAEKQVGEFMASGLPQLSASVDLSKNLRLQRTFLPENIFDPVNGDPNTLIPLEFGVQNTGFANLAFEQMLFDGSFFMGLKAARTFTELARKQHERSQIEVVETVTKAYYTTLINYKLAELVERNFSRVDSLLNDTRVMYDNGFVEKIDVDRIKVQHNNAKVEYDHFTNTVIISERLFKYQIGLPLDTPIELTDRIDDLDLEYRVESGQSFDYKNRIEYSSLLTRQMLNDINMQNTRSQYIPTLDLYFNYGGNVGAGSTSDLFQIGDWQSFSVIGIRANWKIFDGLQKRNIVQQRKFEATQLSNDLDTMTGLIDLEVNQSISDYNKSIDNMRAQKENMELADNIYTTTEIKYRKGVGSNSEVLDADAALKQAQTNYYNALFDALVAKVELKKALGELHNN